MKKPKSVPDKYSTAWNRIIHEENPIKSCDSLLQKQIRLPENCRNASELAVITAMAYSAMECGFETFYSGSFRHPKADVDYWKDMIRLLTIKKPKKGIFSSPKIIAQMYMPDDIHYDVLTMRLRDEGHGYIPDRIVPSYGSIALIEDRDFRRFVAGFYDRLKDYFC